MGRVFSRYILYCGITSALALFGLAPRLWAASTVLVSVSSSGVQGNGDSPCSAITPDGRYVAFCSSASNLVTGDANGRQDVFVRDLVAGTTECVSISSGGAQGNQDSAYPPASPSGCISISSDGRYVAFCSNASNLVANDTNGCRDVFVRDRTAHTTEIASIPTGGGQGNGDCEYPVISSDGRYVAFVSFASNLVAGDTNGCKDVFVRDRLAGTTERVSISSGGAQGNGECSYPAISADGRYVAFGSSASNLVAGDTSGRQDIFVRDRTASTTERVSVSTGGTQGNGDSWWPGITPDGRCVAYESAASNLVAGDTNGCEDVFVRDRTAGTTEIASIPTGGGQGNSNSAYYGPVSLSSDGRRVAFQSYASNLVAGDTNGYEDIFLRDRIAGTTEYVSISAGGAQGNNHSFNPCMSGTGRFVGFSSAATNLVAGGSNGHVQVYVKDRGATLTLTKAAAPSVQQGGLILYSLECVNPPGVAATGVVIRDPLPANTTYTQADNPGWSLTNGTARYSIGTLAANASQKVTLKLRVPKTVSVGTAISNTAYVDYSLGSQTGTSASNGTGTKVVRGTPPLPGVHVYVADSDPTIAFGMGGGCSESGPFIGPLSVVSTNKLNPWWLGFTVVAKGKAVWKTSPGTLPETLGSLGIIPAYYGEARGVGQFYGPGDELQFIMGPAVGYAGLINLLGFIPGIPPDVKPIVESIPDFYSIQDFREAGTALFSLDVQGWGDALGRLLNSPDEMAALCSALRKLGGSMTVEELKNAILVLSGLDTEWKIIEFVPNFVVYEWSITWNGPLCSRFYSQ